MTYRDDHAAAIARIDALEHEHRQLAGENERLTRDLADAREWLGGPRKRAALLLAALGGGALFVLVGLAIGRGISDSPHVVAAPTRLPTTPQVTGVIIADGPKLGHWMLTATRCTIRDDGVELSALGSEDHNVWLSNAAVEIELPNGIISLDHKMCIPRLEHAIIQSGSNPTTLDGYVYVDCQWDENRLAGRIDFARCTR